MYFTQDEYERRWSAVYDRMDTLDFDVAVIWSRSAGTYDRCADVLYLTNYFSTSNGQIADAKIYTGRGFACVILANRSMPELHIDEPMPRLAELATDRAQHDAFLVDGVAASLRQLGVSGRVAFVGSEILPVKYAKNLERLLPDVEWEYVDDLVEVVRAIKSPQELDCYRHAGEIASRASTVLTESLVRGDTEAEAAGAAANEVLRSGGQYHSIPINHGDTLQWWTRDPINQHSTDRPEQGDLIRGFVLGPIYQGYWLDPGRTTVCGGKPNSVQKEMIEGTAAIIEAVIAAIKPGVLAIDVARIGERMVEEFGSVKDQIAELVPLVGHGIGLFWENPYIGEAYLDGTETFEAGMVLGIEAFLGREGHGSTAMENNVIVTETGTELLITTPLIWH